MKNSLYLFFQKLSRTFITNRELGGLVVLFIIFFGIMGFVLMPKQYNPEIVAPAFRINTEFPYATTNEVYELISRPMENKIGELSGVDEIYSESREGFSSVLVTFDIGSDKEDAKINLVQRLRSNMDEKPQGAKDPLIEEVDTDDVPIITLALRSENLSQEALRSFALDLADRIKHVKGAAKTIVRGGYRADISVFVDVKKLEKFSLSITDVQSAIQINNFHTLSTSTESDPYNITARVFGNIEGAEDLKKIVIAQTDGSVVRVEDVAWVSVGEMHTSKYVGFSDRENGRAAVFVGVAKKGGENATTVSHDIQEEIDKLKEHHFIPNDIDITIVRDDGEVARKEIGGLTQSLVISISIVVMILLLFLNTRSALIVAIAIPLSLLSVFGLGLLFGETINRITLFALILSLGLLVDNTTVVIENIYRHLKSSGNKEKEKAITNAVAEVGSGLVMSTITTILAFIPMAFVTGMMGPYMGPIPFFVPGAILASLFIALFISPLMSYMFLRVDHQGKGLISQLQKKIQVIFGHIEKKYVFFLRSVFEQDRKRRMIIAGVIFLLLFSFSLPLFGIVKFRMLPKADRNQFYVYIDANDGTNVQKTNRIAIEVENLILKDQDEVLSIQRTVGVAPVIDFNGLFKGSDRRSAEHLATLKVNLIDKEERKRTSEDIASKTRYLLTHMAVLEDVNIKIIEDPPGPPVLATYYLKVQGEDLSKYSDLREIASDLAYASQNIPGVVDIDTTRNENGFERTYRVNTEKATRLGVSTEDIFTTMRTLSHGVHVDLYRDASDSTRKFTEPHYISLIGEQSGRSSISDMKYVTVRSRDGSLVALTELIDEVDMPTSNVILMDDQYPTVYISGEMEGRGVVYASIDMLMHLLKEYRLPSGNGHVDSWNLFGVNYVDNDGSRYYVRIGGEWQLTLEVFRDLGIAFSVAIFLIYFVLVAQFRSLRVPLYIMATIPLSFVGVLPGFAVLYFLTGTYFNATSMIGVIALSGIVVNNAIIYLEYFFYKRNAGMNIDDALIAAGRTRLLPIVLTSLTTVLGSLTIITDPVWEGLAWAIITGLSLSAFLTLVMLPILYRTFEKDKIMKTT